MNNNELLLKCRKGDNEGVDYLYKNYHQKLFRVCLKFSNNDYDAYDYLHDGFIHILNKINTIDIKTITNLDGWLCTVMRNFIIDQIRSNKKQIYCDFNDEFMDSGYEDEFMCKISHNTLLDLVDSLTPQFKKVFIMYVIEEKPHKEIAKELDISVSTSKTNYHRAKKVLKKRLLGLKLT